MTQLSDVLAVCHLALLAPLAVLGLHKTWMVLLWWRRRAAAPRPLDALPADPPRVTVQLPLYNERFVVDRLLRAVAALDYPRDRLQVQVLDDSTDDTGSIVEATLRTLPGDLDVAHIRRGDRVGFKAGALAHGLESARGELIAIFDADFVPPADFLRRTVGHFADEGVGLVQARWGHTNRDTSTLTRVQALLLDGHFRIEQPARAGNGCLFNFNGTAGVFRRACIEDAGGWQHDTLTEDMDLSYRAQLAGWRFVYLPDLRCPAELPVDMNGFLTQQHRWAKGSIQTGRKLLGRILAARLPLLAKVESVFHLLGNLAFPLLLGLILVAMPLQLTRLLGDGRAWHLTPLEELPLLLATLSVLLYYGLSQVTLGRASPGMLLRLPLVLSLGAGTCLNNTVAVVSALRRDPGEFRRTPKSRPRGDRTPAYHSPRGALPLFELVLGAWAGATAALAGAVGLWSTAVFHGLFAVGLLWVGLRSLHANWQIHAALPIALAASCSGGNSTTAPIRPPGSKPEIVACRARIGSEHSMTEVVQATRQGLGLADLVSRAGQELGVRVHPDGLQLVYARERRGGDPDSRELFSSSLAPRAPELRLTGNAFLDDGPCWSPDGAQVVFSSTSAGDRDLWRIDAEGGGLLQLTSGPADDRDADWHASVGIVFSRREGTGPARLHRMDPSGAGVQPLTDGGTGEGDFEPAVSPDGRTVLFVRRQGADLQTLMRLVLGNPAPELLSDGGGADRFPRWSPRGDRIFVARSRPATGLAGLRIYAATPDGGDPQLVFPDARFAYPGFDLVPGLGAWSPPAPGMIDVDERRGDLTMRLGLVSRGVRAWAIGLDGNVLGVSTRPFDGREVAGVLLTLPLGVADPTRIASLRVSVTMALTRVDGDAQARLALRNTELQRYDTVLETTPADDGLHTYTFSTQSLAHVDRAGVLRLEVIGDLPEGPVAELLIDDIAIELRVRDAQ